MSIEEWWSDSDRGKSEVLERKNLSPYRFVHGASSGEKPTASQSHVVSLKMLID